MALMGNSDAFHFSFSVVVLGDAHVGKSSLVACTVDSSGLSGGDADPATDHGVKCKVHTYESRGARYQILMWEVPGAPRYLNVAPRYAAMAAGALLVFDITRRVTFDRIVRWLEAVDATSPDLPKVLVGNKSDGASEVTTDEAYALAQKHGCKYFETYALRSDQVRAARASPPPQPPAVTPRRPSVAGT
jgi:small GTP-binding protein